MQALRRFNISGRMKGITMGIHAMSVGLCFVALHSGISPTHRLKYKFRIS